MERKGKPGEKGKYLRKEKTGRERVRLERKRNL
jgi:hypothetical protein